MLPTKWDSARIEDHWQNTDKGYASTAGYESGPEGCRCGDEEGYEDEGDNGEFDEEQDDDDSLLPVEQRLMNKLLWKYERAVRPVKNASDTVVVRMGLTITQIFDLVSLHMTP